MPDARPTLAAPDDDPYLWLEEIEGQRALVWVDAQTEATLARFGGAAYAADRDALRTLLDRPDNIPVPGRRGGLLYNFWRDAAHPRGVWRRTRFDSYRTDAPDWDVVLDVDALALAEGEDWVWQGAHTLMPHHDRAILRLSRGGSDAAVLREFDMVARALPARRVRAAGGEGRQSTGWTGTRCCCPARSAASPSPAMPALSAYGSAGRTRRPRRSCSRPTRRTWRSARPTTGTAAACSIPSGPGSSTPTTASGDRTGPKQPLDLPTDAHFGWHRGWMAIKTRTPWTVCGPDLRAGHDPRHRAGRISRRRPRLRRAVRARAPALPAGISSSPATR
ncbi:MAG: hypothetical protein WDN49_15120 [Acetobacteraceae bacterium]